MTVDQIMQELKILQGDITKLSEEDQEKAKRLIAQIPLASLRPESYGNFSVASYYKPRYAKELKAYLNKFLAAQGKDLFFNCAKFKLSKRTLVTKWTQAWQYLIDHEGEIYANLRKKIEIRRELSGIRFRWKDETELMDEAELLTPKAAKTPWREQLYEFLNKAADQDLLEIKNLKLNDIEISSIVTAIGSLLNFHLLKINRKNICVCRNDAHKKGTENA